MAERYGGGGSLPLYGPGSRGDYASGNRPDGPTILLPDATTGSKLPNGFLSGYTLLNNFDPNGLSEFINTGAARAGELQYVSTKQGDPNGRYNAKTGADLTDVVAQYNEFVKNLTGQRNAHDAYLMSYGVQNKGRDSTIFNPVAPPSTSVLAAPGVGQGGLGNVSRSILGGSGFGGLSRKSIL